MHGHRLADWGLGEGGGGGITNVKLMKIKYVCSPMHSGTIYFLFQFLISLSRSNCFLHDKFYFRAASLILLVHYFTADLKLFEFKMAANLT